MSYLAGLPIEVPSTLYSLNDVEVEFGGVGFFHVLIHYSGQPLERKPGTYLIFREPERSLWELLYVGSSSNLIFRANKSHPCFAIPKRLNPHHFMMMMARYSVSHREAQLHERKLIKKYSPLLNVTHNRG